MTVINSTNEVMFSSSFPKLPDVFPGNLMDGCGMAREKSLYFGAGISSQFEHTTLTVKRG